MYDLGTPIDPYHCYSLRIHFLWLILNTWNSTRKGNLAILRVLPSSNLFHQYLCMLQLFVNTIYPYERFYDIHNLVR